MNVVQLATNREASLERVTLVKLPLETDIHISHLARTALTVFEAVDGASGSKGHPILLSVSQIHHKRMIHNIEVVIRST